MLNRILILLLSFFVCIIHAQFLWGTGFEDVYKCSKIASCQPKLNEEIVNMMPCCNNREEACEHFYGYANKWDDSRHEHYPEILEDRFLNSVLYLLDNETLHFNNEEHHELKQLLKILDDKHLSFCYDNYFQQTPSLEELSEISNINWPEVYNNGLGPLTKMGALGVLRKFGLNNIFFRERVTVAFNDPNKLVIELDMPEKMKPLDTFTFDYNDCVDKYFIAPKDQTGAKEKILLGLEDLDKKIDHLRKAHKVDIYLGHKTDTLIMTMADLKQKFPNMDWSSYFSALFERQFFDDSVAVQVKNFEYFKELAALLEKTDEKTFAIYTLITFIEHHMQTKSPFYRFHSTLSESVTFRCGLNMLKNYEMLLNYLHWRFVFPDVKENVEILQDIFKNLKAQFMTKLQKNKYKFSARELNFVKNKLEQMELRIGNTPVGLPEKYYRNYYKGLEFSNKSAWINDQKAKHLNTKHQHDRIFEEPTAADIDYFYSFDDSRGQPFEPYYMPQRNVIIIPQPFLAMPYFSRHMDKVFQYATTAFGIARAIIEAFEPKGLVYDSDGKETDIGYNIIRNPQYQNALNCLRVGGWMNKQHLNNTAVTDKSGLDLVIDTYYHQIPTEGDAAVISNGFSRSYKKRELFFLYFSQYFSGRSDWSYFFRNRDEFGSRLDATVSFSTPTEFADVFDCRDNSIRFCQLW